MHEFGSRFANLKSDRFEERINVELIGCSNEPAERHGFALTKLRQARGGVGGIEGEQQHAKFRRIAVRVG